MLVNMQWAVLLSLINLSIICSESGAVLTLSHRENPYRRGNDEVEERVKEKEEPKGKEKMYPQPDDVTTAEKELLRLSVNEQTEAAWLASLTAVSKLHQQHASHFHFSRPTSPALTDGFLDDCMICFSPIEKLKSGLPIDRSKVALMLPCEHYGHDDCLRAYWKQSCGKDEHGKPVCFKCKQPAEFDTSWDRKPEITENLCKLCNHPFTAYQDDQGNTITPKKPFWVPCGHRAHVDCAVTYYHGQKRTGALDKCFECDHQFDMRTSYERWLTGMRNYAVNYSFGAMNDVSRTTMSLFRMLF